ncbi:hypothetical protein Tco_1557664, partial [Tanacetum coccineum]
ISNLVDSSIVSRDNTRRTVPVETSNALVVQDNALIVQDRLGYDWSYVAQDEPTEFTSIFDSVYYDDDLDTCNSPYVDQVVGA